MIKRKGKFMQVYSGRRFWPLDPFAKEIEIEDIAHALSNQCRFSGHTEQFYSVAQHCVLVSLYCDKKDALAGLLHDASEAYLVDIPRPVKSEFIKYLKIEKNIMKIISRKFNFQFPISENVIKIDNAMLWIEKDQIMKPGLDWYQDTFVDIPECMKRCKISFQNPAQAENSFLNRFIKLKN